MDKIMNETEWETRDARTEEETQNETEEVFCYEILSRNLRLA